MAADTVSMAELGKDPFTWSFTKLFGVHVRCDLHELEGLPGSHAWRWKGTKLWQMRLVTKAQCVGVAMSIVERSDRIEFLVDDGTSLLKAVQWGEDVHSQVSLGDLVHVEGKLNVDKNWDVLAPARELRVLRISKLQDANEELLHWTQVVELVEKYYSVGGAHEALVEADGATEVGSQWEDIAAEGFFSLTVNSSRKQQFLSRSDAHIHDDALLGTLASLLRMQKESDEAITITFTDHLAALQRDAIAIGRDGVTTKNQRIQALQYAFRMLHRTGLLFMEDDATDRHVLLTFEMVLKPMLLQLLQGHTQGRSMADIADEILTQEQFKCIPLQWIETSVEHLVISRLVVQREESHLFFIK